LKPSIRAVAGSGLFGPWRSLVAHLLWEQDVAGSNPAGPTNTRA
jgi:3-methyladenine DNA glycosylase/8-oxoguanine DNA glycosylase